MSDPSNEFQKNADGANLAQPGLCLPSADRPKEGYAPAIERASKPNIEVANETSLETLEFSDRITVSATDYAAILDAIENPRPPTEALREAFKRYRERVQVRE